VQIWSAAIYRRFCFSPRKKQKSGGKAPHSKKRPKEFLAALPLVLSKAADHA
jgi:hypothetical protein